MHCQDVATIIVEIARDRLLDAVARERGLEHAEACAQCAALLAEERALSVKLRALATAATEEALPTRVETALLAAFEQRFAAPVQKPSVAPPRRRWLLAVAALALVGFGLALANRFAASAPAWGADVTSATPQVIAVGSKPVEPRPPEVVPQTARLHPAAKAQKRQGYLLSANLRQSSAEPHELVTRFFPVHQGSELIPLESAQIIRVRMPRANLISWGIPVNQERAGETIQADVMISNDGMARAIRLVY